jgi:NADH:ubiquinone oxidoreductase subunit 5 (subunit L)/multisubunit Na+/H+ antiporter MnhA subunit
MQIFPLLTFVLVPFVTLIAMWFMPKKHEWIITTSALIGVGIDLLLYLALLYKWVASGFEPISNHVTSILVSSGYTFDVDLYFDGTSAVFFGVTCVITMLIFIFSKFYMHRDPGFLRYFVTIMLFFIGLSIVILSGNFEVLFIGWEWIGISSFLLIGYYRDRFLPVRNALKVFSLYRIADSLMLVAIWLTHHAFERAVGFSEFRHIGLLHGVEFVIIALLFFMVAWIKSAQFPFSYWLPRAMEGPTTSSAIFYGALSVHMGLFILLRTYPLWEGNIWLRLVLMGFGLVTAIVATAITRVQSSIKTQIAYGSITQIGIMFIEIAVGLPWLALLHMVSNACLRTYQLLISPSIVGYLIHDQFYYFVKPEQSIPNTFMGKVKATLFVLSIKEWNMNAAITNYIWKPLKSIGRSLRFLDKVWPGTVWVGAFLSATLVLYYGIATTTFWPILSIAAILAGLMLFIRAYSTKNTPDKAWNLIMLGQLFVVAFFMLVNPNAWQYVFMYELGILVPFIVGNLCLTRLARQGETSLLFDYSGHVYEYPRVAFIFLVACLGLMMFPITPMFLIQDMLLNAIPLTSVVLVVLFAISYLLCGISIMRLYTKVFLGPHKKRYHEVAAKSS